MYYFSIYQIFLNIIGFITLLSLIILILSLAFENCSGDTFGKFLLHFIINIFVTLAGLEPAIFGVKVQRVNQLHYRVKLDGNI